MASRPLDGLRPGRVWRYAQDGGGRVALGRFARLAGSEPGRTRLAVAVFPDLLHDSTSDTSPDPRWASCRVGLSLDGVPARDQHGHVLDGRRGCLVGGNWNLLLLDLPEDGDDAPELTLTSFEGSDGAGWLQVFGPEALAAEPDAVIDRVRTTRGSHSAFLYSRGNTLPRVGLPHAMNHLVPLTAADERNWLYTWHAQHGSSPALQGFGVSHLPSPWLGDRGAFQVTPWMNSAHLDPARRQLAFDRADEVDRVHRYATRLRSVEGHAVDCELVPTRHGGIFSFDFGDDPGPHGVLLTLPFDGRIDTVELPDGRLAFTAAIAPHTGWKLGLDRPDPPTYVYGETSAPALASRRRQWRSPFFGRWWRDKRLDRGPLAWLRWPRTTRNAVVLDTDSPALDVRLCTSFVSVDNARANFEAEQRAPVERVRRQAADAWTAELGALEIAGGTADQRTTAWSCLAQVQLWPSRMDELLHRPEVATGEVVTGHASPYRPALGAHTDRHTGCEVLPGPLLVNSGYWDSYRTAWPWYHLMSPSTAPGLDRGILQQYRDGGWMARWAAPGYVDLMVGTSSDAIFADAAALGLLDADELDAYDSALRNATTPPADAAVGRKQQGRARFRGWTDTDVPEGLSWTLDNAINDAALALWSGRLAQRAADDPALAPRAVEFAGHARWFAQRASTHRRVFHPRAGFYVGREPSGEFRVDAQAYDPTVWGHDYTETNGWGQRFHAPHDGVALAELLGGERALADALDELLATPAVTRPSMYGSYGYNTQEMNEAQNHGLGQLAISNQPAHHIPYMYLFAGRPDRTQWLTRELLDTRFVGSEIGQGYPGDEDNGELSAWWLFTAMGLYPLFVGSGEYVITAPLFERFAMRREDGTTIEVRATGVEHRYIQRVRINGEPWHRVTVPATLATGDLLVEVELGPEPSDWGADSRPLSSSTLPGAGALDLTGQASTDVQALTDDRGEDVHHLAPGEAVTLTWPSTVTPKLLSVTRAGVQSDDLTAQVRRAGRWEPVELVLAMPRFADQVVAQPFTPGPIDGLRLTATRPVELVQLELF